MSDTPAPGWVEFRAERTFPVAPGEVWRRCTTAREIERWWSPEDLRTSVLRFDPRPGGTVVMRLRYLPALLGPANSEAFRAAGVPIGFNLRGRVEEAVSMRRLVLRLTLDLGRSASGIDSTYRFDFAAAGGGTSVTLFSGGPEGPHWAALGQANVEGQLDRLGLVLADRT